MNIWILIAFIVAGDGNAGVSVINQEFTSQERCESAKTKFMSALDSDKLKTFSNNRAICVQK